MAARFVALSWVTKLGVILLHVLPVALVTKCARETKRAGVTKRAATSPFQIFHHHRYVASLYY